MKRTLCAGLSLLLAGLIAGAGIPGAARANPQTDPAAIWPAGLERLAGRYVYAQISSPGGLWERFSRIVDGEISAVTRQVSIDGAPDALQELLRNAEIIISDIEAPTEIRASERVSPAGRGLLRNYREVGTGHLVMRNLPGIGINMSNPTRYVGPAQFALAHISHSNPSVSGVLTTRMMQEQTWGAATLDYADLEAIALRDAPPAEDGSDHVIGNARILRSGMEIFAHIYWVPEGDESERRFAGSVRLIRDTSWPGSAGER